MSKNLITVKKLKSLRPQMKDVSSMDTNIFPTTSIDSTNSTIMPTIPEETTEISNILSTTNNDEKYKRMISTEETTTSLILSSSSAAATTSIASTKTSTSTPQSPLSSEESITPLTTTIQSPKQIQSTVLVSNNDQQLLLSSMDTEKKSTILTIDETSKVQQSLLPLLKTQDEQILPTVNQNIYNKQKNDLMTSTIVVDRSMEYDGNVQPLQLPQSKILEPLSSLNPQQKNLPIDNCTETFQQEYNFLDKYHLEVYKYYENDLASVVYSRNLKTHYLWKLDRPLDTNALNEFKLTGHTLTIDYTKTYCRAFALDLDCLCRCRPQTMVHISEGLILEIQTALLKVFESILRIPAASVKFSIWKNKCGYHMYSNIFVSLPTHLYLKRAIEVQFNMRPVIFEVPDLMPLPYSAKRRYEPYTQVTSDCILNKMHLTMCTNKKYLELFQYSNVYIDGRTVAHINTMLGDTYLVRLPTAIYQTGVPKVVNVKSISMDPSFLYMRQFEIYIMSMVTTFNKENSNIGATDLSDFGVEDRFSLRRFMSDFNNKFAYSGGNGVNNPIGIGNSHGLNNIADNDNMHSTIIENPSETCEHFIQISAVEHGGFNLQHYTAALYHAMDMKNFEMFRKLLLVIYKPLLNNYASVKKFIKRINLATYQAYHETSENIINHLHYLHRHNVDPTHDFNTRINTIMCSIMNMVSYEEYAKKLTKLNRDDLDKAIIQLLTTFMNIFVELRLVYFNRMCSRYYILCPSTGTHYISISKLSDTNLPSILRNWIGNSPAASLILRNNLEHCHDIYSPGDISFSTNSFMFSTELGVFNSATGMYVSNTRFIQFNKYRRKSIWNPILSSKKMHYNQNETIIESMKIAKFYTKFMHTRLIELYTHAIIAPAFIQMRKILSVEECMLTQLINIFAQHTNFECMYFLVEYFPFDPKIIYLLAHLCNEYDGLDILLSYRTMRSRIFNFNDVSCKVWRDKLMPIIDSATFDDTCDLYMDKLLSLRGPHIQDLNRDTYLFIVLILACIVKCPAYNMFVTAFNIKIPEIHKHHEAYTTFNYTTTLTSMRENFDRARTIVFGEKLSKFDNSLIDECISICMSTNFIPETTSNYLATIGLSFLPINIQKKIIVFHGDGDVGKSLICNKLQEIANPQVGRFNDLSKVLQRSNVAEYSVTIISELKLLVPSEIKSITGNDPESTMKFYSQNYELQTMQSLMYGATNVHVKFHGSSTTDVDRTTVNRLYAILLTGRQCPANVPQANLLTMMTNGCYYTGILSVDITESAISLAWLAYCTYYLQRDQNYHPYLNTSSPACRDYQNTVYYNNSKLYRFLVNLGIIDEPGFFISKSELLRIVSQNFDKNDRNSFPNQFAFITNFEQQTNISLTKSDIVPNFQQSGLIQHIFSNMAAIQDKDSKITGDDITQHLKIYTSNEHKSNAFQYFQRTYEKYYNYDTLEYDGIAFQNEGVSYDENIINDPIQICDPNSLVLQNV